MTAIGSTVPIPKPEPVILRGRKSGMNSCVIEADVSQLIPGQTYHVCFDDAGRPYLDPKNRQQRRSKR